MSNLQTNQEVDKLEVENTENKRQPDNIVKVEKNGTTYTFREFMVGTKSVEDIVAERIIQEMENDL